MQNIRPKSTKEFINKTFTYSLTILLKYAIYCPKTTYCDSFFFPFTFREFYLK